MKIKYADSAYLDVDSIVAIRGSYESNDKKRWTTEIIIGGQLLRIDGMVGKNILDAYLWNNNTCIYDMTTGSSTYKKQIRV